MVVVILHSLRGLNACWRMSVVVWVHIHDRRVANEAGIIDVLVVDEALLRILQARLHSLGSVTTAHRMRNSVNPLHAHLLETSTRDASRSLDVVVDAAIVPVTCSQCG
jgi:hypothetical protein